jgi:arylsulfatase A-like enzyme
MNQTKFTIFIKFATGLLLLSNNTTEGKTPNVILILADDLGYGDLGCYGQKIIETINIDALANTGILFTQHYAGSAVSAPSRSVLLTGLHTGHTPIRGNDEMPKRGNVWSHQAMLENPELEGQYPMPANTFTLGKLAQEAGYTTAMIGKWGLGHPGSESTPNKMGFDFFYGYNCQRQSHTYYPMFLYKNEERIYLDNAPLLEPNQKLPKEANKYKQTTFESYIRNQYSVDLMFDELTSFVNINSGKPFFLMWTTPLPHVALQAPQLWIDYYVKKLGEEEPYIGHAGYLPARYPRATYAAMISYLDEQIGKLTKQLKELGLYENTVIIFTSDNGATFNGGTQSVFFNSNGIFNSNMGWGKASLHEGGIRVPFIISWPAKIKHFRKSDHISCFYDYMPTLADIMNVKCKRTDGISFYPDLVNQKQKTHPFLYWEFPESEGQKAIRMGKWKGLWRDIRKGNKHIELYNLETDPREQYDISSMNQHIIQKMMPIFTKNRTISPNPKFEF